MQRVAQGRLGHIQHLKLAMNLLVPTLRSSAHALGALFSHLTKFKMHIRVRKVGYRKV